MAVKNPKNKGNAFERVVAKKLSDWAGVKFMRTPSSGAIHNFKDKRVVSDIVAPLSIGDFPFSIECKNVMCNWEISAFMENTSVTIKNHWKQCEDDAKREGLLPMLIFTKNFRDTYVMIRQSEYIALSRDIQPRIEFINNGSTLVIMSFDKFLSLVSVSDVLSIRTS